MSSTEAKLSGHIGKWNFFVDQTFWSACINEPYLSWWEKFWNVGIAIEWKRNRNKGTENKFPFWSIPGRCKTGVTSKVALLFRNPFCSILFTEATVMVEKNSFHASRTNINSNSEPLAGKISSLSLFHTKVIVPTNIPSYYEKQLAEQRRRCRWCVYR